MKNRNKIPQKLSGFFNGVLFLIALLNLPILASGQREAWPESLEKVVLSEHTIPGWLNEGPFIQARGGSEPLIFIARRGHGFSFLRNLQERRGFADPSLEENWKALFNDETVSQRA